MNRHGFFERIFESLQVRYPHFHRFQIVRSNNKWDVIANEKPYYFPNEAIHTTMNAETKWFQFVISIDMPCEIWAGASVYSALKFTTRLTILL